MQFNQWLGALLVLAFLVSFRATLLPLHRMLVTARLVDTLQGLVVLYATGSIFCYFLILGYMRTVPMGGTPRRRGTVPDLQEHRHATHPSDPY